MSDTSALQASLHDYLLTVARRGHPVTYRQACEALGLTPPGMIQALARLLEASMHDDATAGRPFLAALVVSQGRERQGLPAPGFFATAHALGRCHEAAADDAGPAATQEAARRFHAQELMAVLAAYG